MLTDFVMVTISPQPQRGEMFIATWPAEFSSRERGDIRPEMSLLTELGWFWPRPLSTCRPSGAPDHNIR
jgi:hypothetical protein